MMGWTFINLRTAPVEVVSSGGSIPFCAYGGREFSGNVEDSENLDRRCPDTFGGAFSVAVTLRFDKLDQDYIVIDWQSAEGKDRVLLQSLTDTGSFRFRIDGTLHMGSPETVELDIPGALSVGLTHRFLATVSEEGHMHVYRDGVMMGHAYGPAPRRVPRPGMFVAGYGGDASQPLLQASKSWSAGSETHAFDGLIQDLWAWTAEVSWTDAVFKTSQPLPAGSITKAF